MLLKRRNKAANVETKSNTHSFNICVIIRIAVAASEHQEPPNNL